MSDTIFGSPSANAMQPYHRGLDDLSDMIFIPYDQQIPDFTQKSPAPMQPYLSFDEDYNSANIQDLQLQLYQELRNQVMWQDMRGDMSFNSSHPEYESISADSSANTPTFDQSMSSFLEPRPMSSMSSSVESTTATANATANFASVPEPEYVASRPKPKAKSKPKKHKRKHVMPRSKKGCWICRIKHLKCDEKRPHCEACRRFGIECDFSEERPAYVVDNELRKQKLFEITRKRRAKTDA